MGGLPLFRCERVGLHDSFGRPGPTGMMRFDARKSLAAAYQVSTARARNLFNEKCGRQQGGGPHRRRLGLAGQLEKTEQSIDGSAPIPFVRAARRFPSRMLRSADSRALFLGCDKNTPPLSTRWTTEAGQRADRRHHSGYRLRRVPRGRPSWNTTPKSECRR